jgi:site-specific DNA-methyltransferase (adenine-specific)
VTIEPYYEDERVVLYHGDCHDILPALLVPEDESVVVTDPPYGIDLDPDYSGLKGTAAYNVDKGYHSGRTYARIAGDDEPFDPSWLGDVRRVLFGVDHYLDRLEPGGTLHAWDKRDGLGSNMFADLEYLWSSWATGPSRLFRYKWLGYMRAGEHEYLHPTQKPVALMRWILGWTPPAIVIDPYAGSGSTLRAAKDLGRRAIGIELVESYCEIAARRLGQEVLPLESTLEAYPQQIETLALFEDVV